MRRSNVIMMCGVSGSGKTTFAKQKEAQGYIRLSIDEKVWEDYGHYGVGFPADLYEEYTETAEHKLKKELVGILKQGKDVVIDFSFWSKSKRDEYKRMIEEYNGNVELIYLRAPLTILRSRLKERNKRIDANAAYEITDEILTKYFNGFEEPNDEGETVIDQSC